LAHLLHERFGPFPIVAVDDDPRVLTLGPELLPPLAQVQVVVADAFQYVGGPADRFDYLALDLFRGGEIPRGTFARPFLRRLRMLMAPGSALVVNLFVDRRTADRQRKLARVFHVRAEHRVGKNLVVHCKA
jgi:spermidine synthase